MSKNNESKPYIIIFKNTPNLDTALFGSLQLLHEEYKSEIKYSLSYLRKIDFYLEDYSDDKVIIRKQGIKRSMQKSNFL